MNGYRIALIPGDGIGVEVMQSAREVLGAVARTFDLRFDFTEFPWSCQHYVDTGRMMPEDGIGQLRSFDAILLGAVGYPTVPDHVSLWGLLIPIRREFQQYACVRPVKLLPGVQSPLALPKGTDIDYLVVRENNEGEYSTVGGRSYAGTPHEVVTQVSLFTRRGTERIIRYAFELARARGKQRVTSATKSNGIIHSMPFWDEVFADVAAGYPDIESEQMHVDALAAKFVLTPQCFGVVVGSNLFGDILTDLSAATVGSIGIGASANLNPEREFPSCFEPVHGSAPDIVGQGIANPLGQVWSAALMLEHLGEPEAARAVEDAMQRTLEAGIKTGDLGGSANTAEVTAALVRELSSVAR
ncbi:tartrate dehydrogenase [Deinococcus peraridilitoris]|uniref:D-malate dehydrogenase (decarboxylating) n=1 Tax=Deinococcus peraridilitoris (strain DSM 19664 / LMG 22246 / CIP 109416 / KR-200) TaxID=937777 RepID=K9ZZ02_DEIPD|nr:tartrate dehydrogenase [Deinococcus peraridilitoris]AFZ66434.1 tartrate dehydrogenase [Deinococcus peraridilitoris DSM 19664]